MDELEKRVTIKPPLARMFVGVAVLLVTTILGYYQIWWSFGLGLTFVLGLWMGCYLENIYRRLEQRLQRLEENLKMLSKGQEKTYNQKEGRNS